MSREEKTAIEEAWHLVQIQIEITDGMFEISLTRNEPAVPNLSSVDRARNKGGQGRLVQASFTSKQFATRRAEFTPSS